MKHIAIALAILVLSVSFARAQDTAIDLPGVHVHSNSGGASVDVPGISVQSSKANILPKPAVGQVVVFNQPITQTSYVNATLTGMDFSRRNLTEADFSNSTLTGSNFSASILTHARFSNATLTGVDFSGAQLLGASLANTDLSGANLTNADLSGADLSNATLTGTIITGTKFDGAKLVNVDMSECVRTAAPAVVFVQPAPQRTAVVDAQAITTALKAPDKKIDLTINFDFNSDKLTSDGARQVAQVATSLKDPSLAASRFMIEGHTDNVGSESYNKDLSYRRAARVMRTLSEQYNIEPARLSSQGFGKSKPVASNDTDLGRAQNRRVTIVNLGN